MALVKFFILFKLHFQQKKKICKLQFNKRQLPLISLFLKFNIIQKIKIMNNIILI
jgi:uncharacterized membrane protein